MNTGYFIRYRIYGINNIIIFHGKSQYMNWVEVMEENFREQFEIVQILPFYL